MAVRGDQQALKIGDIIGGGTVLFSHARIAERFDKLLEALPFCPVPKMKQATSNEVACLVLVSTMVSCPRITVAGLDYHWAD